MSEEDLLFEIKPQYNILYVILSHFWDILVFIFIMVIIRITATITAKCDYSIFYIFNMFVYWIIYK